MITPRQKELLLFINNFQRLHGYGPSYNQMKWGIHLKSASGISRLLTELHKRGFIKIHTAFARGIEILKMPPGVDQIPATREHKLEQRLEALESRLEVLEGQDNFRPLGEITSSVVLDMRGKIR